MTKPQIEDIYPVSPLQQGMLFQSLYEPGSGVYFEQLHCELEGDLDVAAFQSAWQRVLDRHPVLRTAFDWENLEQPVQVVIRCVELPFALHDWCQVSGDRQRECLEEFLRADRARGFDLAAPPLLRLLLFRAAADVYHFVWSHHHLLLDGWSMPLLFGEFFAFYQALREGREPQLPQPRPYRDYIAWLQRQDLSLAEEFWRRELEGFTAPTWLGIDAPMSHGGEIWGEIELGLDRPATAALGNLVQRNDLTLSTAVHAAWALLLGRRSGEEDVLFGSVVSGRPPELAGVEAMIGLFLNTLPVRVKASVEERFLAWAAALQERLIELRSFEHSPLVQVQGWSQVPRGLALFESLVVFENYPLGGSSGQRPGSVKIRDYRTYEQTNYPLTLVVKPGLELVVQCKYDRRRFDAAAVEEMLRQLRGLLMQMVEEPQRALGEFSLFPSGAHLLADPSQALSEPVCPLLPALFRDAAVSWPEAAAVEQGSRSWSYRELAASASVLAEVLLAGGLRRGDVVAVLGPRSFGLVSSALGVLEGGGVLLLVDPQLPEERRRLMLRLGGARHLVVVGQRGSEEGWLQDLPALTLWTVDRDSGLPEGRATESRPTSALPDPQPAEPAYLFFTSGTTGVPKAVVGCHRGLGHFLAWQRSAFEVGPEDRSAQLTGLSFDVVLRDLFLALISGATLCLPEAGVEVTSPRIPDWLSRQRITLLHTVPSLARAWLASVAKELALPGLRWVFFAGEPLTSDLVGRWRESFGGGRIGNLYGPTETTLAKCFYEVPDEPLAGIQPIGYPLPQTQVLILTEEGRRCGIGEPGEIVIRTPFRTLGYLDPSVAGAGRFVPNPFRSDPEDLLYRTGDRGRYRTDGLLEILGRADDQVKIRGVRVEPAEIEAVLRGHPDVREAVVAARQEEPGSTELTAYVVPRAERSLTVAGMPRHRLPNNLAVAHLNKNETEYLYREVFQLQAYGRHGISLEGASCVVDVGANIGLFLLFVDQARPGVRVYSFEPNPTVFERLQLNASLYGCNARLFNFGLSDTEKTAEFTFFPGFSMLSGLYTDAAKEKETIKHFMLHQQEAGLAGMEALVRSADEILAGRFEAQRFAVRLRTLSQVFEEEGIERVDLLKVNVEKSELDVLRGIRNTDWRKIEQIVLEVDLRENLDSILSLLASQGYETVVMQDPLLRQTDLFYVYAAASWSGRRLIRDPSEGDHLLALPLLPQPFLTVDELGSWARERLPAPLIPSAFVMLEALPLTANGKLDRPSLPSARGTRYELRSQYVMARDAVELVLVQIWEVVLGIQPIGVEDNFFDLGGHSLLAVPLMARIEKRFGMQLSLATLFQSPTVERLAQSIRRDGAGVRSPLLPLQPLGSRLPLFCVHPLGGGALCYQTLARHLGLEQPLYGLDALHLVGAELLYNSLEEMAAAYIDALRIVQSRGPYLLAGWSFGGIVAFEMARQLEAQGERVGLLAVIDTLAPEKDQGAGSLDDFLIFKELLGSNLELTREELQAMGLEGSLGYVVELGKKAKHLPADYDVATVREILRIVKMNGRNAGFYTPRPYSGRITFFQAVDPEGPLAHNGVERWRELAGELEVKIIPGSHRKLVYEPYVQGLAQQLRQTIAEATVPAMVESP